MMGNESGGGSAPSPASEVGKTRYKGVRRRKWGRWVSEIRLPNSRDRMWLGSYDSPEKAARALDAASVSLRGRRARLNFPDSPPPRIFAARPLTHLQIQAAAARHAAGNPSADSAAVLGSSAEVNSPPETTPPTENASNAFAAAGTDEALDWSFMDSLWDASSEFLINANVDFTYDFTYDFISPLPPADAMEDHGGGDFDVIATSSLSSFCPDNDVNAQYNYAPPKNLFIDYSYLL